jgi:hypothetical protein
VWKAILLKVRKSPTYKSRSSHDRCDRAVSLITMARTPTSEATSGRAIRIANTRLTRKRRTNLARPTAKIGPSLDGDVSAIELYIGEITISGD